MMKHINLTTIASLVALALVGASASATQPPAQVAQQPAIESTVQPAASQSAFGLFIEMNPLTGLLISRNQVDPARQALPLINALLGQWATNNGRTQYYFTANQVTIVTWQTPEQAPPDQTLSLNPPVIQVLNYEITHIDETSNTIRVHIKTPLNWLEDRILQFNPDRQSVTESMDVMGHHLVSEWVYVGK